MNQGREASSRERAGTDHRGQAIRLAVCGSGHRGPGPQPEPELRILSAHRTPGPLEKYLGAAGRRGIDGLLTMAGHAAALPGVVAARTTKPVIGVRLPTSDLHGQDAWPAIEAGRQGMSDGVLQDDAAAGAR